MFYIAFFRYNAQYYVHRKQRHLSFRSGDVLEYVDFPRLNNNKTSRLPIIIILNETEKDSPVYIMTHDGDEAYITG